MRKFLRWLTGLLVERGHDEPPGQLDVWDREACPDDVRDERDGEDP